jgi:hypothetical protein
MTASDAIHSIPDGNAQSAKRGRGRFFVAGAGLTVLVALLRHAFPMPDVFVVAAALVIVALRVRGGPQWRWASFVAGSAAVGAAALVLLFFESPIPDWFRTRSFDSETWITAPLERSEARVWMVDDLLQRPLVGMQVEDVDALLGPDECSRRPGEARRYGDREWYLGPERGFFRVDSEMLILDLDEAGTVARAWIYRD